MFAEYMIQISHVFRPRTRAVPVIHLQVDLTHHDDGRWGAPCQVAYPGIGIYIGLVGNRYTDNIRYRYSIYRVNGE